LYVDNHFKYSNVNPHWFSHQLTDNINLTSTRLFG